MQDTETDLFGTLDDLGDGLDDGLTDESGTASSEVGAMESASDDVFEIGTGGGNADAAMGMADSDAASDASTTDVGTTEPETETEQFEAAMMQSDAAGEPGATESSVIDEPMTDGGDGAFEQALAALADAFASVFDAMPVGIAIGLVAAAAVVFGIVFGLWLGRRRRPRPARQEPVLSQSNTVETEAGGTTGTASETATLAPENPAFKAYQRILEDTGVPAKDQDIRLRDFAATMEQLRVMLNDLTPMDPSLRPRVDAAREALSNGDFAAVVDGMELVGAREAETGQDLRKHAEAQLNAAATARIVAGDLLFAQMAYGAAAESYRAALDALPLGDDARRAEYLNKLGTAAYQANDMDTAAAAFEEALAVLERHLGAEHPDVATALNNLALLQYTRGRYQDAEPLYQRALAIDEAQLGDDHPGVATDLNNLALLYKKQDRLAEAEPLLKRALDIKEKAFDPGHPSLVTGLKNYASLLRALGRDDDAASYEQRAGALPPKRRSDERAA